MADPRLFRLRVTFHETGRLAMLSHLELARALERAVRRAQLPFAVSQGFSPHMRIAFGAALPVGVGGTAEIFDLFLTDYVPAPRALTALQEASPADLYPTEARYIEARDAAASVALPPTKSCSPRPRVPSWFPRQSPSCARRRRRRSCRPTFL